MEVFVSVLFSVASSNGLEAEFEWPGKSFYGTVSFSLVLVPRMRVSSAISPGLCDKEIYLCYKSQCYKSNFTP